MKPTLFVLLTILIFVVSLSTTGQPKRLPVPWGTVVSGEDEKLTAIYTENNVTIPDFNIWNGSGFGQEHLWSAPAGRKIVRVSPKNMYVEGAYVLDGLMILLDDGTVYFSSYSYPLGFTTPVRWSATIPKGSSDGFSKIVGDAVYATSTYNVHVTRDTGATWQLDTAGLGANFSRPRDIDLDSSQYVYLAHENGLFKQHPDSNVWHKLMSFPHASANAVFVDKTDKLFSTSGSNLHYSTDYGTTWTSNTIGLESSSVTKFGDDRYGNVYSTDGSKIFKSTGGTQSWARIDAGITAISVIPTTINTISGDSMLIAATNFGVFASSDQGSTWVSANTGIPAENLYGFAKLGNLTFSKSMMVNRYLASTALGVFYNNSTETTWTKTFPVNGYSAGWNVSRDGLGNIYINKKNGNVMSVYKSTDAGLTWNADTAGISSTSGDVFIIDEQGNQHRATNSYSSSSYAKLYVKPYGGSWQLDETGFISSNYNAAWAMGADRNGNIYVSGIYGGRKIWRRTPSGPWTVDSAGIPSYINYPDKFTSFRNGDAVASATYYLLQRNSTTDRWSVMSLPSGSSQVTSVSVDSSDRFLVSVTYSDGVGKGVYYSTDRGTNWIYAGLDSIKVTQLISYGDTTYALTDGRGMYAIGLGGGGETTYSLTTNAVNGSIMRSPNQTTYTSGSSVELTAVADSGYHFTNWSGDASESFNPLTILMDVNKNITANFDVNSGSVTNQYNYNSRWNLVSVPLDVTNDSALVLFPTVSAGPFSYQGTYNQEAVLVNGKGYWMKFPTATTQSITGTILTIQEISVSEGWNLIGSIGSSVAVANITSTPPGITTSSFYTYNGRYGTSTIIEPGKGYWVKSSATGTLTLSSVVSNQSSAGRIKIVQTNELPPSPPEGVGNNSDNNNSIIPSEYSLEQNYPNPFNPTTVIRYQLPVDSRVTLMVYNTLGEEVATLVDGLQVAGYRFAEWNALQFPSGLYFYRISAGDFSDMKKLILLK